VIDFDISPQARADLVDIRLWSIEQFGGDVADKYFLGFDHAFDLLVDHPQVGPSRPELGTNIRCLTHRQHRIFYSFDGQLVLIIRIVHHAMDVRRALKQ
jgi:toxin ParE1/3/4